MIVHRHLSLLEPTFQTAAFIPFIAPLIAGLATSSIAGGAGYGTVGRPIQTTVEGAHKATEEKNRRAGEQAALEQKAKTEKENKRKLEEATKARDLERQAVSTGQLARGTAGVSELGQLGQAQGTAKRLLGF